MNVLRRSVLLTALALLVIGSATEARSNLLVRQYYGGWSHYPERNYYWRQYNYLPTPAATTYNYHYAIHYPAQPQYVYYYNPVRQYYWGRLDLNAKGENCYSLLAEKDRKGTLKEIDEKAFPAPGKLPPIPDTSDGVAIEPVKPDDLPKVN